jgi:50S ribosomal subunit-associated GTPase HflX
LEKRILFLINKYDLVNDDEILKEYKKEMIIEIIDFLKKNKIGKKITKNLIEKNIFVISAATHFGIDKWLDNILNLLDGTNTQEVYNLENIKYPYKKFEKRDMITEITEKEID